jgi:hypothetical protein
MELGFNTSGNNQTSRRTTNAVLLGKLRNTIGSTSRKFKYCNRNSPDLNFTFNCVFNIPTIISGQYQIAVGNGAFAITKDYGANWQILPQFESLNLRSVAISSNGKYILTGGFFTHLFYSNNGGKTFIQKFPSSYWFEIKMSKSGQYQTAIGPANSIYVSNDYGNTFNIISQSGIGGSSSFLAMSYDGKFQSITSGQSVLISNNYGQIWNQINLSGITPTPSFLKGISMSGNGQIQIIIDGSSGYIYRSNDFGNTWNYIYTITESNIDFYFTSMSESGKYILIPNYGSGGITTGGSIWVSSNYGSSFTNNIIINGQPQSSFGVRGWYPCGVSSSGQFQSVCDYDGTTGDGGYIYTSSDYGKSWYSRPSGGESNWWGFFIN